MTLVLETWASWLAFASLQVCALLILTIILERVFRGRLAASFQTALWSAVLLRLVIPPIPGAWTLATLPTPWSQGGTRVITESPDVQPVGGSGTLMFVVWMIGVVASAALAFRNYRRSSLGVECDEASLPSTIMSIAAASARDIGLARLPRLAIGQSRTPYVIGAFRPVVVLPATLLEAETIVLRHVLLHEFAHVKRRDTLAALVSVILQALYWFHPGVWVAARRLSICRELACDALAARAAGSAAAYRRTLLDMARPLAAAPAGVGLFGGGELITRLMALESGAMLPSRRQRFVSAIAGALLLSVSAAAVGYTRPPDVEELDASGAGCLRLRYAVYAMLAREAAASEESR